MFIEFNGFGRKMFIDCREDKSEELNFVLSKIEFLPSSLLVKRFEVSQCSTSFSALSWAHWTTPKMAISSFM